MTYPTNKVGSVTIPWLSMVTRADPEWQKGKRRELAYDFPKPGRYFYEDPAKSGVYGQDFSTDFGPDFNSPSADRP